MRLINLVGTLLFVPFLAAAQGPPVCAQPMGPGMMGHGMQRPGARYMHMFDPKTITTVDGEVMKINSAQHMRNIGVHATIKTSEGEIDVHLGPSWFIDNQDVQLKTKDKITVTGSKVSIDGQPAIIGIEIRRGEDVLKLRDSDGTPLWVAWRKRAAP